MERTPFEELVRRALMDVNYQEYEQFSARADTIAYNPSPRYLAWEKKFLAAPFDYAKKRARPMWQRFLRTAACILLAVSIAFGGVMAVSPTARAWVQQIFAEWFGDHARFSFSGNAGQETGEWKTTWLPEGFELVEEKNMSRATELIYKNEVGDILRLRFSPGSGSVLGADAEYQSYEKIIFMGTSAYLSRATLPGEPSYLLWIDNASSTVFKLTTTGNADNLLPVAEGISKAK